MEASTIMKHNAETNVKNAAESLTTKTTKRIEKKIVLVV